MVWRTRFTPPVFCFGDSYRLRLPGMGWKVGVNTWSRRIVNGHVCSLLLFGAWAFILHLVTAALASPTCP